MSNTIVLTHTLTLPSLVILTGCKAVLQVLRREQPRRVTERLFELARQPLGVWRRLRGLEVLENPDELAQVRLVAREARLGRRRCGPAFGLSTKLDFDDGKMKCKR